MVHYEIDVCLTHYWLRLHVLLVLDWILLLIHLTVLIAKLGWIIIRGVLLLVVIANLWIESQVVAVNVIMIVLLVKVL